MEVATDIADSKDIVPPDCVVISDAMDETSGTNTFEVGETSGDTSDVTKGIEGGIVEVGETTEDISDVTEGIEGMIESGETSENTSGIIEGIESGTVEVGETS